MNYSKLFQDIKEQRKVEYLIPFNFSFDKWIVLEYGVNSHYNTIHLLEGLIKLGTFNSLSALISGMIDYMDMSNDLYFYKDIPTTHHLIKYLSGTTPLNLRFFISRNTELESIRLLVSDDNVVKDEIHSLFIKNGYSTGSDINKLVIDPYLMEKDYIFKKNGKLYINRFKITLNQRLYKENKYKYKVSLLTKIENKLEAGSGCNLINIINLFFIILCKVNNVHVNHHELRIIDKTYGGSDYDQNRLKSPLYKLKFKDDFNVLTDFKANTIDLTLIK